MSDEKIEVTEVSNNDAVAEDANQNAPQNKGPKSKFGKSLDTYFEISQRGSTIKQEIIGGVTTFFAMVYIMFVNPSTMSGQGPDNAIWQAIFVATALGAIVGTLLMALYAKMPFAQAPGMGLNAFFFVSFMLPVIAGSQADLEKGFHYGLSIIFVAGILFMIISFTGIRKKIATSLPDSLKKAIPAGIGLFIAFIGFQNAGIITANPFTLLQLADLHAYAYKTAAFNGLTGWYAIAPILVAFFGLLSIGLLSRTKKLNSFAVIASILGCTALYYLFNINNPAVKIDKILSPADTFTAFGKVGVGRAFLGFKYWEAGTILSIIMAIITFCLVDMFDTIGTLQGTCAESGQLDQNGNPINMAKCMESDAIATVSGSIFGTSTVTTYVESAAGVSAGARTGLASVITAALFFITMFLTPLAQIIPGAATAPALIYVGYLMLKNIKDVDMANPKAGIPAFLTLIMMPLTYSISNGIAIGMIAHTIMTVASIRSKEDAKAFFTKDIIVAILAILFILRFFLVSM
ncbi:MAG TPA: NCS2 family permease [Clostridiales bacterium]|nr:NCS2 family permease [Clostridiales bacterium]